MYQIHVFIHVSGIQVSTPQGQLTAKAMLIQCSVDLPARAMVTNTKQFNGKFGCIYCYNPGTTHPSNPLHRFWPDVPCALQSFLDDVTDAVNGRDSVSCSGILSMCKFADT